MITFKELYSNLDELKVVSASERKRRSRAAKIRNKNPARLAKIARGKLKMKDPAAIRVLAMKKAKDFFRDKFFPQYKTLPYAAKVKIDTVLAQKYSSQVNAKAKKLIPIVTKSEKEKVIKNKQAKKDA